ncbi:unnamed protein product [Didymodactylos carnosus]|uniref:Uncharacterized protein n=1 Tax=Didymodactylos carnosus TaxID=1234261 RepID=A0A816C377_9BILA|nr:unnamed protein product [Didymodactylos carnosus]CAF4507087.1 unnamed protein product [Didymodactylos carnosus]
MLVLGQHLKGSRIPCDIPNTVIVDLDFWKDKQNEQTAMDWYELYIKFLSALKSKLTKYITRDKYKSALPQYILGKLKYIRKVC